MKILVVEDDRQFAHMLTGWLIKLGYLADYTSIGEHALEILKEAKPDVLLSNLELRGGGLQGDDILTHLHSVSPKTIPIVITAHIKEIVKKKLSGKGNIRCLYKPIKLDEVESLLKELEEELDKQNRT